MMEIGVRTLLNLASYGKCLGTELGKRRELHPSMASMHLRVQPSHFLTSQPDYLSPLASIE